MIQRYAVIQQSDNVVVNVIMWDGVQPYDPGEGLFLIQSDTLDIGDTYAP